MRLVVPNIKKNQNSFLFVVVCLKRGRRGDSDVKTVQSERFDAVTRTLTFTEAQAERQNIESVTEEEQEAVFVSDSPVIDQHLNQGFVCKIMFINTERMIC